MEIRRFITVNYNYIRGWLNVLFFGFFLLEFRDVNLDKITIFYCEIFLSIGIK